MNEQHMIHVGADVRYLQEQLAEAEARADEAERLLLALAGWAECAVEDTTISAETYWRELPRAIKEARAFLARNTPEERK